MIGLDTNVLVRYLAQDEPKQAALATELIEGQLTAATPGFISLIVLAELCWVLKSLYGATQEELTATAADLLGAAQFHLERREVVQAAIQRSSSRSKKPRVGLVDLLITQVAAAEGCARTVSFDKAAVRSAGMTLLA